MPGLGGPAAAERGGHQPGPGRGGRGEERVAELCAAELGGTTPPGRTKETPGGRPDQPGRPDKPGKPDDTGKPADTGKPDDTGKPGDTGKPAHPGKPATPPGQGRNRTPGPRK
ncbi:hypothetical protein Asp14428_21940 [Actinoplanes sp. NBRC 14428]|nr:hypothetical protein Asp14428_21940 [Actinoplanes sp. NBRC 14428]